MSAACGIAPKDARGRVETNERRANRQRADKIEGWKARGTEKREGKGGKYSGDGCGESGSDREDDSTAMLVVVA